MNKGSSVKAIALSVLGEAIIPVNYQESNLGV